MYSFLPLEHYTVGAKIKFTFCFHTMVVLRYEMTRSVFTDSSILYIRMIADSASYRHGIKTSL